METSQTVFLGKKIIDRMRYWRWASIRRRMVDVILEQHREIYRGVVLDIGGRARGMFRPPVGQVERWITADIQPRNHPDLVLDVSDMHAIAKDSIDVINAVELFEHVEKISKGLDECARVLKPDGTLLITVPFLSPIHADPSDFQRWTQYRWEKELQERGFHIVTLHIMGRFFTLASELALAGLKMLPWPLRVMSYIVWPLLFELPRLDLTSWAQGHPKLSKYHGGYFILAKKKSLPTARP